jgi:ABC-2 type transport system permease protein
VSATIAIARRELASYLLSPAGYLIAAMFLFLAALVYFAILPWIFASGFSQGQPATLRVFFQVGVWVFIIVGPALSMRALSEEYRLGTIEILMTSPISEAKVILGKFLGSFGFLVLMLLPTVLYVVALERFGRPDYGELLAGYLGLLLVGAAFVATGLFASTLTSSQVLAYVATLFFWIVLLLATKALPQLVPFAEGLADRPGNSVLLETALTWFIAAGGVLAACDPTARAGAFINGLIDTFNVVYFLALTLIFIVAAIKSLAARRWT